VPEIVICGAGVTGASIAWHLASRGVRGIVVLDREPALGGGSTGKATGGFRAQFGTEVNVRLSLLSREKLLRFEHDTGIDPGFAQHGYLFLARNDEELRILRDAQRIQHACGVNEARMASADDVRELNPAVSDDSIVGGTFSPTDGFIRPLEILRGYTTAAERLGVEFRFNREVSAKDVDADVVVNAGGAWASSISSVPVTPLRRRVAGTIATDVLPPSMPMTIWAGDGFHLRVRDGRVLLLWPDNPPDDEVWLDRVRQMTDERIPRLRNVPIDPQHCWSGLYEMSPDRHAILGRDPLHETLYLATGSSGHGVMHAPAIGQLMAELILDGKTSIDIAPLRPSRFAEGDLTEGPSLL
jgi:sarcosine oxidase subunit beta